MSLHNNPHGSEIRPDPRSPNGIARALQEGRELSKSTGKSVRTSWETAICNHELGDWSDLSKVLPHESNMAAAGSTDPVDVANASYAESIRNLMGRQGALKKAIAEGERLQARREAQRKALQDFGTLKKSVDTSITIKKAQS